MRLEDQVSSLELSKRLKELGVKQGESLFIMRVDGGHVILNKPQDWDSNSDHYYSAFTVAELGAMLPQYPYYLPVRQKDGIEWGIRVNGEWIQEKTEADARAKMLIHLIEKGLVTV